MTSQLFKFNFNKHVSPAAPAKPEPSVIADSRLTMSDQSFARLKDFIYKTCGIYYNESKKYLLEGRIAKRLVAQNISSFDEYIDYLQSLKGREELNSLFEVITINETYFFRAEQQFEVFENIIVPEVLSERSSFAKPTFRIWSAASSSGEEAYTLAIIVLEKLKNKYPNVQFQILASDISNAVLDNARKGIYKEYAIRNIPAPYLKKYFTQNGQHFILNDEVKRMVKFMNINLYDSHQMASVMNCDVVFCCNVLIYFDIPSKQNVVQNLYNSLNKGGYLFIGYSESLHGVTKAFKLVHLPKAMAYKKE